MVIKGEKMRKFILFISVMAFLQGCGQSEEEKKRIAQEKAHKEFYKVEFKRIEPKKW